MTAYKQFQQHSFEESRLFVQALDDHPQGTVGNTDEASTTPGYSLDLIDAAYEAVCNELTHRNGLQPNEKIRGIAASLIQHLADHGERDVEKLKIYALAGVSLFGWF